MGSVCWSMIRVSSSLIFSREARRSSSSCWPSTLRRVVCAIWEVAYEVVLHADHGLVGVEHAEEDDRVHLDRHVVARDHVLRRHVHGDGAQADLDHLVHERNEKEQAGPAAVAPGLTMAGDWRPKRKMTARSYSRRMRTALSRTKSAITNTGINPSVQSSRMVDPPGVLGPVASAADPESQSIHRRHAHLFACRYGLALGSPRARSHHPRCTWPSGPSAERATTTRPIMPDAPVTGRFIMARTPADDRPHDQARPSRPRWEGSPSRRRESRPPAPRTA